MSMRSKMGLFAAMAMMGAMNPPYNRTEITESDLPPMPPKPPTGTKEYFFNAEGKFSTEKMLKTDCVFKCFAINDKNAKRKFKNWSFENS